MWQITMLLFSQSSQSTPKYVYCHISQRKAWYPDTWEAGSVGVLFEK